MRQPNLPPETSPHCVGAIEAARDGRLRRRVIDTYQRAASNWMYASAAIGQALRAARELHSSERRFVGEAVYGMVRGRRRLAFAVGAEAQSWETFASPLALYLAWLATELGDSPVLGLELRVAGVDPERMTQFAARLTALPDPCLRLAVAESVPDWMVERLVSERGLPEATLLLGAMNRRAPLVVRANRLKNSRDELADRLNREGVSSRPSLLTEDGLILQTHVNAYGLTAFREGRFELQDAGSQQIAELVAPPPQGQVADVCAGAGGKTLALAALLHNRGRLAAFDVSESKLKELRKRARRAGLTNLQPHLIDDGLPPSVRLGVWDRVLVDAPCSGLGGLRRRPEERWRLRPDDLVTLPRLQRDLLERYAPLVRPGGRLIYATCTVLRAENDSVIDGFLADHPTFEPVSAKEILGSDAAHRIGDGERLRLAPHTHESDGFFAAVVRRRSTEAKG